VLNQCIGEWVSNELHSFQPSKAIAIEALRHLSKKKRADLFSKNEIHKQIAFGQLYEAVIYERLLELTKQNANYSVVRKGDNIRWKNRTRSKLGQDGLFYDETGAIVARGNGQDLAEFDLLVMNNQNEIAYVEVKTSGSNLKEFDLSIAYKRRLLEFLFSKPIQFVLLSCLEIGNKPVIKRIINTPSSFLVVTAALDGLQASLKPEDISDLNLRPNYGYRSIPLSNLKMNKINYLQLHNHYREELISAVMNCREPDFKGDSWLIKRIVVGYLNEFSIKKLLDEKSIIIEKERLTIENSNAFSRVVLALRMPALRPEVYLRLQEKRVYLKMGPTNTSTFQFERNIRSRRTAFFDWLENVPHETKPELMDRIMKEYLNNDVVGSRKKPYESPETS
jgi:hypothetical protein